MRTRILLAAMAALVYIAPSRAWEDRGHMLVNRAAAEAMPADTPAFFKDAVALLEYLGPEPDRWKKDSGPALRAMNSPDHYIDTEFVEGLTLPPTRYEYLQTLIDSGVLKKRELKLDGVGFLPYRITEMTQMLQSMWRDWRAAPETTDAEKAAKRQVEQNIVSTAGILGHFVADAANPHHSTAHHNGWDTAVAPNPSGFTTKEAEAAKRPNGFHSRFEGDFVEAAIVMDDLKGSLVPAVKVTRIFDDSVAFIRKSNALVVPLYEMEKAGKFGTTPPIDADARAFTAGRLGAGASYLRDVWVFAMQGIPPRGSGPRGSAAAPAAASPAKSAPDAG